MWILTVSADGAVPVTCRMADGNTEDSTTHIATWEGYRITWIRSSSKRAHDAQARAERIEAAQAALAELAASLASPASPRCRLRSRVAVEEAAAAAIEQARAARWTDRHLFTLSSSVDTAAVAYDAAADGCFPLITNDTEMTDAELLAAYKRQPRLERRFATFKGVLDAAPVELKSDYRIDALGFCLYAALLVHALIERDLRNAMARASLAELPLYHEDRACKTPTAARVLELLSPLARTIVVHHDQVLKVVAPSLTPLQEKILTLLGVPLSTYHSSASLPRNTT